MYGIETINSLNRKNAEAAAILAKHEQPAKLNREHAEAAEIMAKHADAILAKHAQKPAVPHTPTMFAPVEKINQILEGAKG